jgi:SNF2 family DNA or RNA helicase
MNRWFQASFDGYGVKPLPYAQVEIQDRLRDICLTIDAKDYWDIKDPIVRPVYVDLPPKARGIYDEMQKKMFAEIAGNPIEAFNAASRTNKCLQLANGAVYIGDDDGSDSRPFAEVHTEKIQVLESIIEEACGMPIIVGYNFKSDLARLKAAFPTGRHLHSAEDEEDFIAGKIPILFAHPKSAGHGIDGFQYVTNIIALFGHNWSLEEYIQLIERIGPVRQFQAGLDRPVFVYPIIARDTVDELVMARRESKRSVQDLLLEAMKRAA